MARLHRHLRPPPGGLVAFEALIAGWPVAWGIVGRPVARGLAEWVEVTRTATSGTPNACSALLGAASRWARRAGLPVITYTLESEPGTSLRAAGWVEVGRTRGGQWDTPTRRRGAVVNAGPKRRWWPGWLVDAVLIAVLRPIVSRIG